MFSLKSRKDNLRTGIIRTKSGVATTPLFMPVATRGALKHISPGEIKLIGYEVVLSNTYHLWLRPGEQLVRAAGGLHRFMNWDGSILTDSGGFQVFSLGARAAERFGASGVELSEAGVSFADHQNGKKYFLTPEKAIQIQLDLGSDMIMCLDVCPPYPCSEQEAAESLELTTNWAKRCKEYFNEHFEACRKNNQRPLLFGIVQGSVYEQLRKESARQIVKIGFDGYAIGGVAVGEPREKLHEILNWVLPFLPKDQPRYLMGLGKPEEIVAAVLTGVDMFDCVIPTREGRHGRLFRWKKDREIFTDGRQKGSFYDAVNITNEKYRDDLAPFDLNCSCPLCKEYSRAYVRHLFAVGEPLGGRLASLHNLTFYQELMQKLRSRDE